MGYGIRVSVQETKPKTSRFHLTALCAALLLQACSSKAERAADAARVAEGALNAEQFAVARKYINQALAERDDVPDYWLIKAHADVMLGDAASAFEAFRMLLTFDRGNLEALSAICEIALSANDPASAEKYADQLALLQPANLLPPTVRAGISMSRGDKGSADLQLKAILEKQPDFVPALLLRGKLLISNGAYAESAKLIESSINAGGDPDPRLNFLLDVYSKANDGDNYRLTLQRLSDSRPNDAERQLRWADWLYDDGKSDEAYSVVQRVQRMKPDDLKVAASVLDLWLKHGNVLKAEVIARDAQGTSLETRATYAQYANEMGRPDIALAVLGQETLRLLPSEGNSDAKAAYAYALALRGDRARAMEQFNAILATDPTQPRALIARARVSTDLNSSVEDARQALSDDETDTIARLMVANLLLRRNEPTLAETALRGGLSLNPGDPRVAQRLIALLNSQGREAAAQDVRIDFVRANPFRKRMGGFEGANTLKKAGQRTATSKTHL